MNNSQKILILIGLLALAIFLHVLFCDWNGDSWYEYFKLTNDLYLGPDREFLGKNKVASVFLGVLLPVLLIGLSGFLLLGWWNGFRRNDGAKDK
jgi:small-conductance mechanosensitive channel